MMNILEQEDLIKGLPDQALMQEAQRPSGELPQFLVVSEIQRRSDMRKRYKSEQEQMPQATVKEQVVQEGIMGVMPPQMAMVPQMPQRMPQMPPQGIQQAMPPQMMSGGGIVRMANGGRTQEILDLVAVGLSPLQITQKGYEQAEIEAAMAEYNQRMSPLVDTPDYVGGPMREIQDAPKADPTIQRRPTGLFDDPGSIGDIARKNILEPIGSAVDYVSEIPGRIAQSARMAEAKNPLSDSLLLASDFGGDGKDSGYSPIPTMNVASQQTDYGGAISDMFDSFSRRFAGLFGDGSTGPAVAPGGIADAGRDRMAALEAQAAEQNVGRSVVPAVQLGALTIDPNKSGELVKSDLTQNQAGVDAVDLERLLGGGYDASRVDYGDATIPSGADAAASRLDEYMKLVNDQASRSRDRAFGMATAALGAGILEGKTAQGIRDATKIIGEQDKAQAQVQSDIAKLRVADAREREKLNIMRQDLANKLKITDRQSLMAALKSYGDSITALVNDRTRLMTKEGQTLMSRLTQEQALLRSLLIPDVDLGDIDVPAPTPSQPSGVDLRKYLNP